MSWLRIDDGFSRHPKVTALTFRDRWVWMDLLCYCARYETGGYLPRNIREHVAGASPKYLDRCSDLGLLDEDKDGLHVHDWTVYAPRDPGAAERMRRHREKVPSAESGRWKQARAAVFARDDGICLDCGKDCKTPQDKRDLWNADHEPPREDLVAAGESIYDIAFIVTRCHSCHSKKTRRQATERRTQTEQTTEQDTEPQTAQKRTSRAGTARVPVLSRPGDLPKAVTDTQGTAQEHNLENITPTLREIA